MKIFEGFFKGDAFYLEKLPNPGCMDKITNEKTGEVYYVFREEDIELIFNDDKKVVDIKYRPIKQQSP